MNEPTYEQIERFCVHWGFKFKEDKEYDGTGKEWAVHYPNGEWHHAYKKDIGKLIDLNNLFLWAVPKVFQEVGTLKLEQILEDWVEMICRRDLLNNPQEEAYALFWAIDKVREGES